MLRAWAMNDCWKQIGASLELRQSAASPVRSRHIARALDLALDHVVNALGDAAIGKGRDLRFGIGGIARRNASQPFSQSLGDFRAMRRNPNTGSVDAGASAIFNDGRDHHVQIFLPLANLVLADDDLAVAGTVQLNA